MKEKMKNRVYLRAMEPSDLTFLNQLHNDDEINRNTAGNKYFVSSEYDRDWLDDKMRKTHTQLYLMVCLKETKESIGYLSLSEIDHWNKKLFLSGYTIMSSYAGKGYATEAVKLIIRYAFEEMGMNRIKSMYLDDNETSFHVGEKLGFVLEGTLRDFVYKGGRYHDVRICSILRNDYECLKKEGVYPIG